MSAFNSFTFLFFWKFIVLEETSNLKILFHIIKIKTVLCFYLCFPIPVHLFIRGDYFVQFFIVVIIMPIKLYLHNTCFLIIICFKGYRFQLGSFRLDSGFIFHIMKFRNFVLLLHSWVRIWFCLHYAMKLRSFNPLLHIYHAEKSIMYVQFYAFLQLLVSISYTVIWKYKQW